MADSYQNGIVKRGGTFKLQYDVEIPGSVLRYVGVSITRACPPGVIGMFRKKGSCTHIDRRLD